MDFGAYDERRVSDRRLTPAGPALIWGALMTVAVAAAGASVWAARGASDERLVASADTAALRRTVRDLTAQRDDFSERVARLERGLGEVKLAARAGAQNDVTGSIGRDPTPPARPVDAGGDRYGLDLGPDVSVEAVQRRWTALANRYPQLAKLQPKARKSADGHGLDLVAGPFATSADAARACASLADQGFACDTTGYAGELLSRR